VVGFSYNVTIIDDYGAHQRIGGYVAVAFKGQFKGALHKALGFFHKGVSSVILLVLKDVRGVLLANVSPVNVFPPRYKWKYIFDAGDGEGGRIDNSRLLVKKI